MFPDLTRTASPADPNATATSPTSDAAAPESPAPQWVGRFVILAELARGGMGIVYRAHDPSLDREVAVKVLADRLAGRSDASSRFLDEARVTGQLQHPGIPPVHEVGQLPNGLPFLAMKLIKGRTLDDELKARPGPAADRGRFIAIFAQICQAVGYAHSRGVIHRDLKPANIMVGAFGEVQVMDWGLAKLLVPGGSEPTRPDVAEKPIVTEIRTTRDTDGSYTEAGSMLGTPSFMPPEQAGGEVDKVDRRADVFGLGAILCAILTGKPPYAGDGDAVRLMAVRGQLADAFARLDGCAAEPELIALAKQCLSVDPAERPTDAGAVASTIADFQAATDERLRRAEVERARAEVATAEQRKRRRVQAVLGMAITAALLSGVSVVWWVREQQLAKAADAIARQTETERGAQAAVREAAVSLAAAQEHGEAGAVDVARAREHAKRATALADAGAISPQVIEEVRAIEAQLAAEEQDRVLVAALANSKRARFMPDEATGNFAQEEELYRAAFAAYGTPIGQGNPVVAADRFRSRPAWVRVAINSALEAQLLDLTLWQFGNESDRARRRTNGVWVRRVLSTADPDPWRERIRDVAQRTADDTIGPDLLRLADELDPKSQPAWALSAFLQRLLQHDHRAALELGRKLFLYHANSVDLAMANYAAAQQADPKPTSEMVQYATVVASAYPGSSHALVYLAQALEYDGRLDDAIRAARRLVELRPQLLFGQKLLASCLLKKGDEAGAARVFEQAPASTQTEAVRKALLGATVWSEFGYHRRAIDAARASVETYRSYSQGWEFWVLTCKSVGDVPAYRQACREMIEEFGKTTIAAHAERVAKVWAVDPPDLADLPTMIRLSTLALESPNTPDLQKRSCEMTAGLVQLRAGEWDRAIDLCTRSRTGAAHYEPLDATDHAVEAIAHARKGERTAARASLHEAERLVKQFEKATPAGAGVNWLTARPLTAEARRVVDELDPPEPAPPPRPAKP